MASRHPSVNAVMQYFTYDHLPGTNLKSISAACSELAVEMLDRIPNDNPELTTGLRKLLEAKDCFVRAALYKEQA